MTPLSPDEAAALVQTILTGPTVERPTALFKLLHGVADPEGNESKYDAALSALREVYQKTPHYEQAFQSALDGDVVVSELAA